MIYELLGVRDSQDPELRPAEAAVELSELSQSASDLFEGGDYQTAGKAYRQILSRYAEDPVAKAMLDVIEPLADKLAHVKQAPAA